jgi:hypothetical protein
LPFKLLWIYRYAMVFASFAISLSPLRTAPET